MTPICEDHAGERKINPPTTACVKASQKGFAFILKGLQEYKKPVIRIAKVIKTTIEPAIADSKRLMIVAVAAIKYPVSLGALPNAMTFLTERASLSSGASSASLNANVATKANVLVKPIVKRGIKLCAFPVMSRPTIAQKKHMGM